MGSVGPKWMAVYSFINLLCIFPRLIIIFVRIKEAFDEVIILDELYNSLPLQFFANLRFVCKHVKDCI